MILLAALFLFAALSPLTAQEIKHVKRTTSSSGQFVVYSNDSTRGSTMLRRAEEAKEEWRRRLPPSNEGTHPIIIQDLIGGPRPRGNPSALTAIYEGDGGALKVQTNIYDAGVLRERLFEAEIFRALGLEWIYRKNLIKAGKSFRMPPAWLVEGMTEEIRIRENGAPDGVYTALLQSEHPPKIEDFLKAKPELLEATSLALYRTQALALLRVLEQLPEGTRGLATLLDAIAENEASIKTLLAAYPSLENDPSRLSKIWTLAIARGSTSKRLEPLSIAETERTLSSIFDITANVNPKNPEAKKISGPAALPFVAREEGGPFLMRQKSTELLNLEFRSHPLLKPIVAEYRNITSLLAKKPKKNVEKQIEDNGKIRSLLQQRSDRVSDYLNWFEATQLDTLSGDFLNISEPPSALPRTDPITRHLDAIEQREW